MQQSSGANAGCELLSKEKRPIIKVNKRDLQCSKGQATRSKALSGDARGPSNLQSKTTEMQLVTKSAADVVATAAVTRAGSAESPSSQADVVTPHPMTYVTPLRAVAYEVRRVHRAALRRAISSGGVASKNFVFSSTSVAAQYIAPTTLQKK